MIARALAQEPAFLVMDEPTASLDFANQLHILQLMRDLASDGIGIVFSTHHPDQALAKPMSASLMSDDSTWSNCRPSRFMRRRSTGTIDPKSSAIPKRWSAETTG